MNVKHDLSQKRLGRALARIVPWFVLGMILCTAVCQAQNEASVAGTQIRSDLQQKLAPLIGPRDAVMVSHPNGAAMVAIHSERLLIPASVLKIITSAAALEIMGDGYRFATDFFETPSNDLKIKGYGDPMQVSEELALIAAQLSEKIDRVENVILDDSFFAQPMTIPGQGSSSEPYDAPNGALCVNFNTVAFKRLQGRWISAEDQTPLLPMAIEKIEASGLTSGRITLAASAGEGLRYAGELYRYFLTRAGISIQGKVTFGTVDPRTDSLLLRYKSRFDLTMIVASLMAYSNNFIANQLLLAMGTQVHGPPATLAKGRNVLHDYCNSKLAISSPKIVEASGISRRNRISAQAMIKALDRFHPYRDLMRREGPQWYKTGTLNGIHTRAGYLCSKEGVDYRFVIMLNSAGKRTEPIMKIIKKCLLVE